MVILEKCMQFLSWIAKSCSRSIRTERIHQLLKLLIILQCGVSLSSCADNKSSWQEEVKLLDGRVIIIQEQRRIEGAYNGTSFNGVPREAWITMNLPEISKQEIVWHEKVLPTNLNIFKGKLYLVAVPQTSREFDLYNNPKPPYLGFLFEKNEWKRIPFDEIPVAIYNMNLSIDGEGFIHDGRITLADKVKEKGVARFPKGYIRIDPLDKF